MKNIKPVAIIGAGLAGLTAASFLKRHNIPVRVFEAGPQIAGLARSFHDAEGFTYDFGAHVITNRLVAAMGYTGKCLDVPRYGESVFLQGESYAYPFGLMAEYRFVRDAIQSKAKGLFGQKPATSAAEWFRQEYGNALANEVAIPLTESWSGVSANLLAPSVGEKIPSSLLHTIYLKVAAKITGRTVAIGYCGTLPESPHVWHVYPEDGMGGLCQHLANDVQEDLEVQSPVEGIHVVNERVQSVQVRGEEIPVSAVVSTAPVHVLPKMIRGSERLKYLSRFRYRPMTFVNLKLKGRELIPDVITWTPEDRFPFFRLVETPLCMPWMAPEDKTLLTVDIGCNVGDEIWTMAEDRLGEYCVDNLAAIIPDVRNRYLGCRVLKTPLAYPIYMNEYEAERKSFIRDSGIRGLYSIGRNGEFSHALMEDVFWRTKMKMIQLMETLEITPNQAALADQRMMAALGQTN